VSGSANWRRGKDRKVVIMAPQCEASWIDGRLFPTQLGIYFNYGASNSALALTVFCKDFIVSYTLFLRWFCVVLAHGVEEEGADFPATSADDLQPRRVVDSSDGGHSTGQSKNEDLHKCYCWEQHLAIGNSDFFFGACRINL
jgi:hypothetical protein